MENLLILPAALLIDLTIGEYPTPLHPVVWAGKVITLLLKLTPRNNEKAQFVYGVFMVCFTVALFCIPVFFILKVLHDISAVAYIISAGIILKSTFSLRGLCQAVRKMRRTLDTNHIAAARQELSYLVSRDTRLLDRQHVISAVVEMSAESITDSYVAPLFFWLLLGIPGAVAYRIVNTYDSRIGYHGEYEYPGKFAARLDDILNFIPARLSALLLVVSAGLSRANGKRSWRVMLRDRVKTESPNAGWTMSAMAGALGIRLEKPEHYTLGDGNMPLYTSSITTGLRLVIMSAVLWFFLSLIVLGVSYALNT